MRPAQLSGDGDRDVRLEKRDGGGVERGQSTRREEEGGRRDGRVFLQEDSSLAYSTIEDNRDNRILYSIYLTLLWCVMN